MNFNNIKQKEYKQLLQKTTEIKKLPDIPDKEKILNRFKQAATNNEPVLIWGDYDCDGLTGAVVLYQFFKAAGLNIKVHLPNRSDGYGINKDILNKYIEMGYTLVITVDCGISNTTEIAEAQAKGIDFVITDHHTVPDVVPPAFYTLHPQVINVPECINFAGCGVAYWLTRSLSELLPESSNHDYDAATAFVAIGTIGDMTPLRGLNRDLVKTGLVNIRKLKCPGLYSLCKVAKLDQSKLDEESLAFQIIPRLNAAGRMATPRYSFKLLVHQDPMEAASLARMLDSLNVQRKELCLQYEGIVEEHANLGDPVVFICEDWKHGVIGITAANVAGKFNAPAFLMTQENGVARGSARAPEWFSVIDALRYSAPHLIKFGGHRQAGGFSLELDKLDLFKQALTEFTIKTTTTMDISPPKPLEWDEAFADTAIEDMCDLQPFGIGFKKPNFFISGANLSAVKKSRDTRHLFCKINKIQSVGWRMYSDDLTSGNDYDIIFSVGSSDYGSEEPYLRFDIQSIERTVNHD